jgi:ribosomal protein L13
MRIGFKTNQANVDWSTLLSTWEMADTELDVFDSAWVYDHFVSLADGGPCHEGWTVLCALAARTRRLRVGHLVLSNTYRHPGVLAKMAVSADHLSEGRFVLGLGAGWHEREHEMYGIRLPPIGERITMLDGAVRVLRALWNSPQGASLDASPFHLSDATCEPPPLTPGGPPIWLGTQGKQRGLRIVAELADGWNHTGAFETFGPKRDALLRHCERVGRDPSTITISAQIFLRGGDHMALHAEGERLLQAGVDELVLVMPAKDGPNGLRRLASEVAAILRGKHKPTYTPHMDMGDCVIIVNAGKIRVTGNKERDKRYFRHSQYPGGLRSLTFEQLRDKHPTRPVEKAVRGMLPKNILGTQMFKKLRVYAGPDHPHEAQQPKPLEIKG